MVFTTNMCQVFGCKLHLINPRFALSMFVYNSLDLIKFTKHTLTLFNVKIIDKYILKAMIMVYFLPAMGTLSHYRTNSVEKGDE